MAHVHPTATWEAMTDGTTFYSNHTVYQMQWQGIYDLSDFIIVGARLGGPIAMMRDTSKLAILRPTANTLSRNQIQVWSPAGEGLLLFNWDTTRIVSIGWSSDERLVLLNDEGTYRLYGLSTGSYTQNSLGADAETGILDARIHPDGIVALTSTYALIEVRGWNGGKPLRLADITTGTGVESGHDGMQPQCWSLIPPDASSSGHTQVLLSPLTSSTILSIDSLECVDQRIDRGPFTHIAVSPNGKYLGLMTYKSMLWVVSADFGSSLAEFDASVLEGGVRQVEWSGNDAIVLSSNGGTCLLVGPMGDALPISTSTLTPTITALIPEPDGVRLITPSVHTFLSKVSPSSLNVFRPGSTHPSATLFDAYELFSKSTTDRRGSGSGSGGATKVEEGLRRVRDEMAVAVDGVIDASGREWEPYWQRRLLEAAKFGRSYLDLYNPTDFVHMGQAIKILNAIRFFEVGIPMTYSQYILAPPSTLLTRLTTRHLHLLAFRITQYLQLDTAPVLVHWACAKLEMSKGKEETDEDVCAAVVEKFEEFGGGAGKVKYSEVAKKAWEGGRGRLASMLLDHETRAADQVPLLLQMKEDKMALLKAVDSGDTDLVYHVLLTLNSRLTLGNFFKLLDDETSHTQLRPARKLLEVYARSENKEMLRDFYFADDRRVESAVLALEEASVMSDINARIESVKAAQKSFGEDRNHLFEAKMTEEQARLLTLQQVFEREDPTVGFVGLSVNEMITKCITNGMSKRADKVKSDFKVPDKRFWYLKLHALTKARDWVGLETFARTKKSPIGFEPFVHHLIETGHLKEATSFVARCDAKKRVDLYVECGDWRAAGKECKERNDKARLEQMWKTCPNTLIQRELDQMAASMS